MLGCTESDKRGADSGDIGTTTTTTTTATPTDTGLPDESNTAFGMGFGSDVYLSDVVAAEDGTL